MNSARLVPAIPAAIDWDISPCEYQSSTAATRISLANSFGDRRRAERALSGTSNVILAVIPARCGPSVAIFASGSDIFGSLISCRCRVLQRDVAVAEEGPWRHVGRSHRRSSLYLEVLRFPPAHRTFGAESTASSWTRAELCCRE